MPKENEIQDELKELLQRLQNTEPIDEKGNPFVLLPKKDLIQIKKNIEEISQEFYYHNWKGEDHEEAGN